MEKNNKKVNQSRKKTSNNSEKPTSFYPKKKPTSPFKTGFSLGRSALGRNIGSVTVAAHAAVPMSLSNSIAFFFYRNRWRPELKIYNRLVVVNPKMWGKGRSSMISTQIHKRELQISGNEVY